LEELRLSTSNHAIPLFHQKILAHELTLKRPYHALKKLNQTLASSTVDLNPHQIDAALFAFNCPLSRGAILCGGVGLGKTIEAGLIISQLWAEGKRKISSWSLHHSENNGKTNFLRTLISLALLLMDQNTKHQKEMHVLYMSFIFRLTFEF
jgi:hypothetical protein